MTRPFDKRMRVSKVNAPPRGLQNLLGNVNQGINPHELDQKISPVVDLYPHWAVDRIKQALESGNVAGTVGQGLQIIVPEGELWQPIGLSLTYATTAATNDLGISVGIFEPSQQTMTRTGNQVWTQNIGGAVGNRITASSNFAQRFVLSGGWGVRGEVDASDVVTARAMVLSLTYISLKD